MQTDQSNCISKIDNLNQVFYDRIFEDFSDSRQYYWQGWKDLGPYLVGSAKTPLRVLDLGCGNGRFSQFLLSLGLNIDYIGVDFSNSLIQTANTKIINHKNIRFVTANIFDFLNAQTDTFDLIVAFGVLHHIYSLQRRQELFGLIRKVSHLDTLVTLTTWQFLDSPELAKKVLQQDQLTEIEELEKLQIASCLQENDYILDWNRGQRAFRYGHYYDTAEITTLGQQSSLRLVTKYLADGKNNNGNCYYIFRPSD